MKGGEPFILAILFKILKAALLPNLYTNNADYSTKPVTNDNIIDGTVHRIVKVHVLPKYTKKLERKLVNRGAINRNDSSK